MPTIYNTKSLTKWTPLSIAINRGYEAIVKLLVTADIPSTHLIDENGSSPLTHAVRYQQESILKLLLAEEKISVNLPDKDGKTPLSHGAECGYRRGVKLILATGRVDKSQLRHTHSLTPLFIAAKNRHRDIVKLFLTLGIPIGSTCGYKHQICNSKQHQSSLKRLVNRHIRTRSQYSIMFNYRRSENRYSLRPRRRAKRSSYDRRLKRMHDGSIKKVPRHKYVVI